MPIPTRSPTPSPRTATLRNSPIWRHGRFKGGIDLWNGNAATRTGVSLGLPFDAVPAQPRGTILCDSIRRFKGLDREVVILAELDPDDQRLGPLLYVGASRAREHLVVIAPPELARRLDPLRVSGYDSTSGVGTARTTRSSIPAKSAGFAV